MTDLRSRIAALSPERRELLERRLAELMAARGSGDGERIKPRDRSRPTPLGIAQQREWAVERLRGANNITGAFRIEGALDVALLSTVLTEVLERHEVLRSTVEMEDTGNPVQVVREITRVPVPVVDLSPLSADQQAAEARRRYASELRRGFRPDEPRRLRLTLLRLAEETHLALFATDHAASDAWSMAILVREVAALYAMHRTGGPPPPSPEIQFGDFAAWQRERIGEERTAAEVRHWQEVLAGIPGGLVLPTDRPYPARPAFTGDVHFQDLPPELGAEVRRFGDGEGVSLVMVLLAACSVLLHRYLEQGDVVMISMAAGRTRVEAEQLVGCFANPLPLRLRVSDDQTLRDVVHQARDTMTTALDHQDVPFDRLIEALGLGRESSQTSLSGMWINALTGPDMTLELPDLRITVEPIHLGIAPVALTLVAIPRDSSLQLQWQYMTELFDADTVALLADQFHKVLSQLVTAPGSTVGEVELSVASAAVAGTPVAAPSGTDPGFVELFRQKAALTPHAPAVVCGGVPTSYADLDRESDRLAHRLRDLGVGHQAPVGILVDRSPPLAVAILGVLKAGAGYLPLDPSYPVERIEFMLADARTRVLVADRPLADLLSEAGATLPEHVVVIDDPSAVAGGETGRTPPAPDPESLAYVVYTSGSTGQPKGAMVTHRSLVTFARDVQDRLGLGAGDRFLQFASPSFDVLVEELFPIWLAGGAVVIPIEPIVTGKVDLVDLVERERVTVMELPTAYWHEWVRELDRLDRTLPSCLRLVIIGGERVLPERLTRWRRHGVPLTHVYGLTEATVSSTFFHLDPADPVHDWPNLPIGTPLPSADLRILDGRMRPIPRGGTGELYVAGVSLARGYLGRPGLTAERFVADPDPARPGQRLYRTGDLVRQRADGNLEFISRVDTQIHIRGFRVEPTEIESALSRHPYVAESVAVMHEPTAGDRRLVAYVVPGPGGSPNVQELRQFLERQLPPYMLPSAFVSLDAVPLTTNGKIDRDRLPAPSDERPESGGEYVRPQSATQQKLANIVATVVGRAQVGIHDNFFEVGGDSILAIQVVARAQEEGLQLTPYDIFAHPTVAALAELAATGVAIDAEQGEVAGPVIPAPMQSWFCRTGVVDPHHWNTSVLVELRVRVDAQVLEAGVARVLGHHDGLRQRFQLSGERTRVRIAPHGDDTPFQVHDLSDVEEPARSARLRELMARIQASLDPVAGPLVRVALFRLGEQPDQLAVVAHRMVADVMSLRLVLQDLETAVVQLSAGEELRLPSKTSSWQSWCRRLDDYATTPAVRSQRGYWSELVTTPAGELPYDFPAEPEVNTEATARSVTVSLDGADAEALLGTAPGALDCTVEELLLTALSRTLSDWSGAPRHCVDLERHDRPQLFDDVDVSRTVGWFARTYPVALTCEPDSPPAATLRAVRGSVRTVPAEGMGWQLLCQGAEPVPEAPVRVGFTYLGEEFQAATGAITVVAEPAGEDRSPRGRRPHPIEVEAAVTGRRLVVRWRYSESLHRRDTVQRLADRLVDELRALAQLCRSRAESGPVPSDFPLARVDQAQLAQLLERF